MDSFEIIGGKALKGEIIPQGAKNEALQVISAVLLSEDKIRIENVPAIRDVHNLIDLLEDMGVVVERHGEGAFTFQARNVNLDYLTSAEFRKKGASLRGSIMIVGPLLARFGKADRKSTRLNSSH